MDDIKSEGFVVVLGSVIAAASLVHCIACLGKRGFISERINHPIQASYTR
jgi:hypothetical protein